MDMKRILRPAAVTAAILLIPLVAMQFTEEVQWTAIDFIVMGSLLMMVGLTYELLIRSLNDPGHRFLATLVLLGAFLWLWAELAVGVFTNWGS